MFKVKFYKGFKVTGQATAVSMVDGGETIEQMTKHCSEKFPGRRIKLEVK
ncbi:hypothetical protein [Pseudoalteromonas sp. NBT06-2]|nr:hypothetical protein [Pseudoalteromonas sp. NBT06-2]